jgi:hypothetical protein
MGKITCYGIAVVVILLALTNAQAQSDLRRYELGGQFSILRFDAFTRFSERRRTEVGGGGRFTFNFNRHVAAEAQVDFFPHTDIERIGTIDVPTWGSKSLAVFGIKAGGRNKRVGVFGKVRPGFIHFGDAPGLICIASALNPCPPSIRRTVFSLDVGGVFEYYPSPRTVIRFDLGDTIIYQDKRQGLLQTSHSLQTSIGMGFRF